MPEISRFFGIVIRMYFRDHNPPHFHAFYGDDMALIEITSSSVIAGKIPPRALGLVSEWVAIHRSELMDDWENAREELPLLPIPPLE